MKTRDPRELSPLVVDGDRIVIELEGKKNTGQIVGVIRRRPTITPQRETVRRSHGGKTPRRRRAVS